jgi:hypothetical protein
MSSSPVPPDDRFPAAAHSPERAEALATCRGAIGAYTGDAHSLEGVRVAIRALAGIARRDHVSPEQMLIELKSVIIDAPVMRGMSSAQAEATRAKLVSVAIRAYYGDSPA